jgi:hypothetical protein
VRLGSVAALLMSSSARAAALDSGELSGKSAGASMKTI